MVHGNEGVLCIGWSWGIIFWHEIKFFDIFTVLLWLIVFRGRKVHIIYFCMWEFSRFSYLINCLAIDKNGNLDVYFFS